MMIGGVTWQVKVSTKKIMRLNTVLLDVLITEFSLQLNNLK